MLRDTLVAICCGRWSKASGTSSGTSSTFRGGATRCCASISTRRRGITLDDCERVSRAVSEVLDARDPIPDHYTLEVSSPGFERPLRTAGQFARFVGEKVYVELVQPLDGRRRFKGPLLAAGGETIEVEVDGRRRVLPIAGIRKAHLAPH